MKLATPPSAVVLLLVCAFSAAQGQDFNHSPGEEDSAFAKRVLQLSESAAPHVTSTTWNATQTLFVDYETSGEYPERPVVALQRQLSGGYRAIKVTVGEQEGATPDLLALGFANADPDPAKELIVILAWPQNHQGVVGGTLYEVRIFDDAKPGQTALALLKISQRFGSECDCQWSDGSQKHFPLQDNR
jgi:hypothetical protein